MSHQKEWGFSSGRRSLAVLGAVLSLSATGCGASLFPKIEFPSPPPAMAADPSGAVLLESRGLIRLLPPPEGATLPVAIVRRHQRLLVTGELAAAMRQLSLPNSAQSAVLLLKGRVARPQGEVIELDALDGVEEGAVPAVVALTLPAVKPGDLIDLVYERRFTRPDLLEPWLFASGAPTVESSLEVRAPVGWDVRVRTGRGETAAPALVPATADDDSQLFTVSEREVAAVPSEPATVHPQRSGPWAVVLLAQAQLEEAPLSLARLWQDVASRLRKELASTMAVDAASAQELGRGLGPARLRAVREKLRPVRQQGMFDRAPRPFAAISAGPATPLEAAAVVAAVTADTVEPGYIALVAPVDGAVAFADLPALYPFETALVAFKSEDGWEFGDAACATCEFGKVPLELAGAQALILSDPPVLVEVPQRSTELNHSRLQFDWTLSVDGTLTGVLIADLEGAAARKVNAALSANADDAARLAAVKALLIGADTGMAVEEIEQGGEVRPGEPMALRLRLSAKTSAAGNAVELPLSTIAGGSPRFATLEGRRTAIVLAGPARIDVTSTVQLPPGYRVAASPAVHERQSVGEYEEEVAVNANVVTFTRRLALFTRLVPHERAAELAALQNRIATTEAKPLVIRARE